MSDTTGTESAPRIGNLPTARACVLVDCERPTWNGAAGEMCKGHKAYWEEKASHSVKEPELERKLEHVRTPPPSVEYEPEPDYVAHRQSLEAAQRVSRTRPRITPEPEGDDTLEYLSDALEGSYGVTKAAQAEILVRLAADALRAL